MASRSLNVLKKSEKGPLTEYQRSFLTFLENIKRLFYFSIFSDYIGNSLFLKSLHESTFFGAIEPFFIDNENRLPYRGFIPTQVICSPRDVTVQLTGVWRLRKGRFTKENFSARGQSKGSSYHFTSSRKQRRSAS